MMETTLLRDIVENRLGTRWAEFAMAHPNLAEAIDQTRLLNQVVERVQDDPQLLKALAMANVDEHQLAATLKLIDTIELWLAHWLPR